MSTAALVGGLIGCVDPGKSFDDFNDRVGTVDASTTDRPPSSIYNVSGTFLVAVHAAFETSNDPAMYMQMLASWTLTETGTTATLDASYTMLCTNAVCSPMRAMIPPAFPYTSTVAADGTFEATITGTLPGGANPITGNPQPMTGVLHGFMVNADTVCGSVTGEVAGLDLQGSTFGAIRVTDTTPDTLPAPVANCPN
jgi:hypothetical protein